MAPKLQVETKVFQVRSINILSFGVHAHWHKLHISRGYKKAWTADNGRESVFLIICQRLQSGEGPWFMSICCVILCTWNPWLTRGNSWFETIYNTESIHSSINKCFFLFFPNDTCPSDPRLQENIIWPDPPEQSPCYDTLLSGWFAGGLCILVKNITFLTDKKKKKEKKSDSRMWLTAAVRMPGCQWAISLSSHLCWELQMCSTEQGLILKPVTMFLE